MHSESDFLHIFKGKWEQQSFIFCCTEVARIPWLGQKLPLFSYTPCSDSVEVSLPCFSLRLGGFGNFQKNIQNKSHRLKVQNAFLWSSCLHDLASTAFSRCGLLGPACKPVAFNVIPRVTYTELGILFIPTKRLIHRKIHCIFFFSKFTGLINPFRASNKVPLLDRLQFLQLLERRL